MTRTSSSVFPRHFGSQPRPGSTSIRRRCAARRLSLTTKATAAPPSPPYRNCESLLSRGSINFREDSRGRVNNLLFAVPPPTFTCSVSYDGQESWESDSVHSCEDGDEEDLEWRPGSSSLAAYRSPGPFESDEVCSLSVY